VPGIAASCRRDKGSAESGAGAGEAGNLGRTGFAAASCLRPGAAARHQDHTPDRPAPRTRRNDPASWRRANAIGDEHQGDEAKPRLDRRMVKPGGGLPLSLRWIVRAEQNPSRALRVLRMAYGPS